MHIITLFLQEHEAQLCSKFKNKIRKTSAEKNVSNLSLKQKHKEMNERYCKKKIKFIKERQHHLSPYN